MTETETASASTNAASFKLSLLETCAADPLTLPIDLALLAGYMRFMKWPARVAYLTNLKAMVMTACRSERTISASRARLIKAGYLRQVTTKLNGAALFEVNNPRAEIVADHTRIAEEKLKEMDAFRKAEDRRRQASKRKGGGNNCAPIDQPDIFEGVANIAVSDSKGGSKNVRDSTAILADNSLDEPLEEGAPKERSPVSFNAYAAASRGR